MKEDKAWDILTQEVLKNGGLRTTHENGGVVESAVLPEEDWLAQMAQRVSVIGYELRMMREGGAEGG